MKEIEVARSFEAPKDSIVDLLTPETIVDLEGTFDVKSIEEEHDATVVTVTNEAIDKDVESIFRFEQTDSGYRYTQGEHGVFEALETEILIEDNEQTTVTHRSRYTFGGAFAFIKNWLASDLRREEAERFLVNLHVELDKRLHSEQAPTEDRHETE